MDKLYALCTDGSLLQHTVKDGVHTINFVDRDGKTTHESGANLATVAQKLFPRVDPATLEIERKNDALKSFAQRNNVQIAFTLLEQRCGEALPPQYRATAELVVGDRKFVREFSHWNEEKMKSALMCEAHDSLVK